MITLVFSIASSHHDAGLDASFVFDVVDQFNCIFRCSFFTILPLSLLVYPLSPCTHHTVTYKEEFLLTSRDWYFAVLFQNLSKLPATVL